MVADMIKQYKGELDDDFDFSDDDIDASDESLAEMMNAMVLACQHQQLMAIELTKLIADKTDEKMNAENIFSVFKQASKVVTESFPLKSLWEKFA